MHHRSHFICRFTLSLALIFLSSCASKPEYNDPVVEIVPVDPPDDAFCGTGDGLPAEASVLEPVPGRITPADGNRHSDTTEIKLPQSAQHGTSLSIQRFGLCDNDRSILIEPGLESVAWDGLTDAGGFAEPGVYLLSVKDASGASIAAGRVSVGQNDDICELRRSEAVPLHQARVQFDELRFDEDIVIDTGQRGYLCIRVDKLGDSLLVPFVGIDGVPFVNQQSFTLDTTSSSVSKPVYGEPVNLRLGGAGGAFTVAISLIPDDSVRTPVANPDIPDSYTCRGRLQSYRHPFGINRDYWPGADANSNRFQNGRRPVARGGVHVKCSISFRRANDEDSTVTYAYRKGEKGWHADVRALYPSTYAVDASTPAIPPGTANPTPTAINIGQFIPGYDAIPIDPGFFDSGVYPIPRPPPDAGDFVGFSADGVTNEVGVFEIEVDIGTVPEGYELVAITAKCQWNTDCAGGFDSLYTTSLEHGGFIDVLDVADAFIGGRHARLITNAGSQPMQRGRFRHPTLPEDIFVETAADIDDLVATQPDFFDDGVLLPAQMNDLPVVIHEPFDPLDTDSFDYMVWILGGQPISVRDYSSTDPNALIANPDPCTFPRQNICYGFDAGPGCEWQAACGPGSSPVSCPQANVLKPLLEAGYDIWLVDHNRNATATEVARQAPHLYQYILRYPYLDDSRPMAVSGLSAGGVAARVGLTLWERKDELPDLIADNDLQTVRLDDPSLLVEDARRVVAYFSFDSPHRGALVPVAMQAYLNDDDLPANTNLAELLLSDEAEELTANYVSSPPDTICFEEPPNNCSIRKSNPEIEAYIDSLAGSSSSLASYYRRMYVDPELIGSPQLDLLIEETISVLGRGRGGGFLEELLPDGLPLGPRSFAIANSRRYGPTPAYTSDQFLEVKIKLDGGIRKKTFTHRLFDDAEQPRGSSNPLFCEAYGISSPASKPLFKTALGVCLSDIGMTDALGAVVTGGLVFCGQGAFLVDLVSGLFGKARTKQVTVNADVKMRFPTFLPTESAMNAMLTPNSIGNYALGWEDALWYRGESSHPVHTEVTEAACRFIRYHLDGTMKGDRDGVPACRSDMFASCAGGGMLPGDLLDAEQDYESVPTDYCDCDETTGDFRPSSACAIMNLPTTNSQTIRDF